MFARRIETKRPFPRSGGNTIHGNEGDTVGLCVTTNQLRAGRVGSTPARAAIAHESKGAYANGGRGRGKRCTKHEKEFAIGRTLSTAPRGEFHDRVSGQQHAATQATRGPPPPSLVRVSGIEHAGLVQGRTEGSRARTKRHDRLEPSTADRASAGRAEPRPEGWGEAREAERWGELCEPIEGPSRVSSYTRVPAASFRSVLTHINTRSVCTLTRHPPSPAVFVSSHFFPFAGHPFFFFLLLLFLSSFFSPVPPSLLLPRCPLLGRCSAPLFFLFSSFLPRPSFLLVVVVDDVLLLLLL